MCDTPNSLRDEIKYLERVFHKSIYNADFIKRNVYRPTEADETNRNPTSVTTVTIPYIIINIRGQIENRPLENTRFAGRK